jgi:hypothetical protein
MIPTAAAFKSIRIERGQVAQSSSDRKRRRKLARVRCTSDDRKTQEKLPSMIRSLFSVLVIGAMGVGGWWLGADELLLQQLESRDRRISAPSRMPNRATPPTGVSEYWNERPPGRQMFQPRDRQRALRRPLKSLERRNRVRRFRLRRQ